MGQFSNNKNHVFNPKEEVYLFTDASSYGIGLQLCNKNSSGKLKTVSWTSASLYNAERQYSQLEKEALALVFGLKQNTISTYMEYILQLQQIHLL